MNYIALGIGAVATAAAIACSLDTPAPPAPPAPGPIAHTGDGPTSRPSGKGAADCVGSCSAVKDEHPDLSTTKFHALLKAFGEQPATNESKALETLLFHHDRTRALIAQHGVGDLEPKRAALLKREAERTHAWLDVRVIDESGKERVRLNPTRVPLGEKQHLWPEQRIALQPLEVSGTIKRVGLDHLWTRL